VQFYKDLINILETENDTDKTSCGGETTGRHW